MQRFRGIPFAKPPVGNLRFLSPQEPSAWTEPLETKRYSPMCAQYAYFYGYDIDEDCLYLNVFAPPGAQNLPVMVWIHGGSLLVGSASQYDGETLASVGQVIVVTINYRLNVFGFFSTGDSVSEGNAGLHDQVMALKWVKNNIDKFGGDPTQVTIFGESAGAWSVNMHMVSPLSRGLFHRAISESGSTYSLLITSKETRRQGTVRLAEKLQCSTSSSQAMLDCLQTKSAYDLLSTAVPQPPGEQYLGAYPQVTGDSFLPKHPRDYWNTGNINPADYIMGVNSEEATSMLAVVPTAYQYLQTGIEPTSPDFLLLASITLNMIQAGASPSPTDPLWKLLSDQYLPDYDDKIKNMRGVLDAFGHSLFLGPTMNCLQKMVANNNQKAYLYYFDQVIEPTGPLPFLHIATMMHYTGSPEMKVGAGHGNELAYVFGLVSENLPSMPGNIYNMVSDTDRKVGKSMMNAWLSFAKTG